MSVLLIDDIVALNGFRFIGCKLPFFEIKLPDLVDGVEKLDVIA
jgi:hypothetical protein